MDIIKSGFSTHDLSPSMFIEYLESQTEADIYLLGVQPQNIEIGDEMSENVSTAIEVLSKEIEGALIV